MRRLLLSLLLLPGIAHADSPTVVTDIAPIHALVSRVMVGVGTPDMLVDGASDPHSFQLRPSQAALVQEADLIVWVGPAFTPWLERLVNGLADPSASLVLMEAEHITARAPMFAAAEEAHDDHDHDHGDHDPHIWLDPVNAKAIVRVVADRLTDADPANAAIYAANARDATSELDALDAELGAILAPVKSRPIIVFHDAYAHLANHFDLNIAGALAEGDAANPGAEQVAEMRRMIETNAVGCVFAEALHSDKLITALTDDLAVPVGRLDPEGTTLQPGPLVYPEMMRALARAIVTCAS